MPEAGQPGSVARRRDRGLQPLPRVIDSALRISGLLNYTAYHQIFLRAEKLTISRTDAGKVTIAELLKLGAAYWDALEQHEKEDIEIAGRGEEGKNKS